MWQDQRKISRHNKDIYVHTSALMLAGHICTHIGIDALLASMPTASDLLKEGFGTQRNITT
jgi:hypothetical protein